MFFISEFPELRCYEVNLNLKIEFAHSSSRHQNNSLNSNLMSNTRSALLFWIVCCLYLKWTLCKTSCHFHSINYLVSLFVQIVTINNRIVKGRKLDREEIIQRIGCCHKSRQKPRASQCQCLFTKKLIRLYFKYCLFCIYHDQKQVPCTENFKTIKRREEAVHLLFILGK